MNHTPGPWDTSLSTRTTHAHYVGKRAPNGSLDMVCDLTDSCFPHNAKANARLIAAAPELLEELKNLVDDIETGEHLGDVHISRAKALITEAEGKG